MFNVIEIETEIILKSCRTEMVSINRPYDNNETIYSKMYN